MSRPRLTKLETGLGTNGRPSFPHPEDHLINQRQTWNFTIQGFLFATYGFSQQKIAEILGQRGARASVESLEWLARVIPIVGVVVCLLLWFGIEAAGMAIMGVRQKWDRHHASCAGAEPLPRLTGGGGRSALNLFVALVCVMILGWGVPLAKAIFQVVRVQFSDSDDYK
jgi:hypothetical protein